MSNDGWANIVSAVAVDGPSGEREHADGSKSFWAFTSFVPLLSVAIATSWFDVDEADALFAMP